MDISERIRGGRVGLAAALAALAALGAGGPASGAALAARAPATSRSPESIRIALVDIQKLADGLAEGATTKEKLNAMVEALNAAKGEFVKQVNALDKDLELESDKNSPKARQIVSKKSELQAQAKVRLGTMMEDFRRQRSDLTVDTYAKILEAIPRFAKQEGYDMVLADDRHVMPQKGIDPEQVAMQVDMRKVLYAKDELDVTAQLIVFMNNEYKAAPKIPAPPPPAGPGSPASSGPTAPPSGSPHP